MASSSSSSIQFMTLEELDEGVVKTFQPTDAQLVGCYLYNKIFMAPTPIGLKSTFPEIDIYGSKGLPPWEIWRIYQPFKFPHQDFIYFFSPVKKLNPNGGSRFARTIGSDGGTWSETEAAKPVYVNGIQQPFGKLRKFRYEKNKDKGFEHHTAWLMDEFTINQAPDLALCRLKINDKGGGRNKRKKFSDEENDRKIKSFKIQKREQIQNNVPSTSLEQLQPSDHGQCHQYLDDSPQAFLDSDFFLPLEATSFGDSSLDWLEYSLLF